MTEFFGRRRFPPSYLPEPSISSSNRIFPRIDRNSWAVSKPDQNYLKQREKDR